MIQAIGIGEPALPHPSNDSRAILRAADQILEGIFRDGNAYKKAGVIVSGLVPREQCNTTLSLFPEEEPVTNERDARLMQAMYAINKRYGRGAVHLAAENSEAWKPSQERLSPAIPHDGMILLM